jgi:WhiB family redox-sensing transcriptional regulator
MFFVATEGDAAAAKAVCGRCDVRVACAAFAIAHAERFGIWGGMTERERRNLSHGDRVYLLTQAGMTAA